MSAHRVTLLAQADIDSAWLYIAKDRPGAADRLADRFFQHFTALSQNPDLGETRSDLALGVRQSTVGNYVVLHRVSGGRVEIMRVIHGARDVVAEFKRKRPKAT